MGIRRHRHPQKRLFGVGSQELLRCSAQHALYTGCVKQPKERTAPIGCKQYGVAIARGHGGQPVHARQGHRALQHPGGATQNVLLDNAQVIHGDVERIGAGRCRV